MGTTVEASKLEDAWVLPVVGSGSQKRAGTQGYVHEVCTNSPTAEIAVEAQGKSQQWRYVAAEDRNLQGRVYLPLGAKDRHKGEANNKDCC